MKVGIPRALLYYKYYPFWKSFLEGLGFQILVSPPTNKEILYKGINLCIDEACFPVKVFCGHVDWLKERADCIFVYRLASIEKRGFLCSKFWGLPDIVRNIFGDLSLLTLNIDCNKRSYLASLFSFGLRFNKNPYRLLKVIKEAKTKQREFLRLMQEEKLNAQEAIEVMEKGSASTGSAFTLSEQSESKGSLKRSSSSNSKLKIALLTHPYNLYDRLINLDILEKLERLKVKVFTYEMVPERDLTREAKAFDNIYWTYDRDIAAAASFYIKEGIDGVMFLFAFPCGPDSIIMDYLTREFKDKIPIINLVIDEHCADSGILTRLESFVDIVKRRKNEV